MAERAKAAEEVFKDRLFRLAYEESPEALAALGEGRRVLTWSRGATDLLGWAGEEALGRSFDELMPTALRGQARQILERPTAGLLVQNLDWTLLTKAGGEAKVLLTVFRTSEEGAPGPEAVVWIRPQASGAVRELQDPALRDMIMRMQQLSAVGQIAAALSHQIRTPLHVIQSTVESIEDSLPGESPHLEGLRVVDRNIQRITSVVDSLRTFTRYKSHAWAAGDLNRVVDQVCLFMEMVCKRQAVRLNKSLGPLPLVRFDADYLLGALYNLTGNAVEAMPDGGVLTVTTVRRGDEAVLTIQDTGQGMEPAVLERVGNPFFTTKPSGTGLGMFVVREVLEQHQARLQIESRKGAGTRVVVTFPAAPPS